ncbi:MAG: hypothetical protein KDC83_12105 [Flavobacteriales bacterium]|nr:hypothetical protein [Flavobacteriales bacterium]
MIKIVVSIFLGILLSLDTSAWVFIKISGGGSNGHRDVHESHFMGIHRLKCSGAGFNGCGWSHSFSFPGNNGPVTVETIMEFVEGQYVNGNTSGQGNSDGVGFSWVEFTDENGDLGYQISIDADPI